MKMLIAIPANLEFGRKPNNGVSVFTRNLAYALHQQYGHEITICCRMQQGDTPEDWYDLIEIPDKRTHNVWMIDKLAEVSGDYDLIHVHGSFYCLTMMAYRTRTQNLDFKCPVFVTLHSPWVPGITANDFKARSSINDWDSLFDICSISDTALNAMCKYYEKELNGRTLRHTPMPTFPLMDGKLDEVPERVNRVFIVARMDPIKNVINNLNKAVADVRKHPGWKIDLALNFRTVNSMTKANQYIETESKKIIAANTDIIDHHEILSRDEMAFMYARSKLMYHFGVNQGKDLAPLEASSFGTPVAGYRQLLGHVNYPGHIFLDFDQYSGDRLVTKSEDLLAIAEQYTDEQYDAIKSAFNSEYDFSRITSQWNDHYLQVLGKVRTSESTTAH